MIREKYGMEWFLKDQNMSFNKFLITPFSKYAILFISFYRVFNIWNSIYCLVLVYYLLYVPFSIGLSYDIPR